MRGNHTHVGRRYRVWARGKSGGGAGASAGGGLDAIPLPSADARDALFSVQRFLLPPHGADDLDALLEAHRNREAILGRVHTEADTTVLLSDASGLGTSRFGFGDTEDVAVSSPTSSSPPNSRSLYVDPWCRARAFLSHEMGPSAVKLRGGVVALRLATSDALGSAARRAHDWTAEGLRWQAPTWSADALRCETLHADSRLRITQAQQRLLRALAMLLVRTAKMLAGAPRLGGDNDGLAVAGQAVLSAPQGAEAPPQDEGLLPLLSGVGSGGRHRGMSQSVGGGSVTWPSALGAAALHSPRYAVPLACLEPDFMDHNRELLPRGAASAYLACEPRAIARSARLAAALHARIGELQNASHVAACNAPADGGLPAPGAAVELTRRARRKAERAAREPALVAVGLHPSGFFSLLHGLLKPLMLSLRTGRVLLTPRTLEFTSETFKPSPCEARDLSCFFEPLAPACDAAERLAGERLARIKVAAKAAAKGDGGGRAEAAVGSTAPAAAAVAERARRGWQKEGWHMAVERQWPVLAPKMWRAREDELVYGESRAARQTPPPYHARGWFWWSSHLLSFLLRPNERLRNAMRDGLASSGLRAALDAGSLVIGMHVRHGDACRSEEIVRARRSCTPLREYMAAARRVMHELPARGGQRAAGGGRAVVYLATDSLSVLRESQAYAAEFDVVTLPEKVVARHNPKDGEPLLWDRRVWQRFFWGQTAWTMQQAWDATMEMLILAHADAFVGKFTSNLFRAAYALRAAQCDCAPLFVSLDAPMCFDYGISAGRNWEFPKGNGSGVLARGNDDMLFQC